MTLRYEDAGLRLFHGSNKDILPTLPDAFYDSIVTDPPYELGFMGKGWDSTGIAYDVDMWRECFRLLKPGGYLLSFGGTRTWHRIAVAIEDAGFEIRDSIAWMYGSGFPKSMDVSKAIDKLDASSERRARALEFTRWMRSTGITARQIDELTSSFMGGHYLTERDQAAAATADMFDLLRPLLPEVPARIEELVAIRTVESKNFAARVIDTRPAFGIGGKAALGGHAEGATQKITGASTTEEAKAWEGWGTALKPAFEPIIVARKPLAGAVAANVLAYGTGAINIDACRVPGESTKRRNTAEMGYHGGNTSTDYETGSDSGRFPANVLLDESQAAELDRQAPATGGSGKASGPSLREPTSGGVAFGARNGLEGEPAFYGGEKGGASRFFPTFRYEAKAPGSERPEVDGVAHATVKPLELMRWLVRLVTRPGGRVLEPFAGSGTTGEAALLEGMEVDLIELEADHLPLILQRVRKPLQPSLFGDLEAS